MSTTVTQVQQHLRNEGLNCFLDSEHERLLLPITGINGRYQVIILVEQNGEFIQFRTMNLLSCPKGHPNLEATLRVLASINYRVRYLKLGWDPSDGEIVGYGDSWLRDSELTPELFRTIFGNFVSALDRYYPQYSEAVATGQEIQEQQSPADQLRARLTELMEGLRDQTCEVQAEEEEVTAELDETERAI